MSHNGVKIEEDREQVEEKERERKKSERVATGQDKDASRRRQSIISGEGGYI